MKILFIHPNMPGQYKHHCRVLAADKNNQVVFITKPKSLEIPNVHKVEYKMPRDAVATTHRYLIGTERAVLQGQEVWRVCKALKEREGFVPDVICAHPGWGDALFIKDIYPDSALLNFFEFYYQSHGSDVNFDKEYSPASLDDEARVRIKNITNILSLESADWGISPTFWQKSVHPIEFQSKISVLHDGIDTEYCHPDAQAEIVLPSGKVFRAGDKVVTYIARNFEPYRGFPTFMRAAELLLKERSDVHIIAVGADEVSYGRKLGKGNTWREEMLKTVKLDMERVHFTGVLSYAQLIKLFQISAAHIYLTYPFVLSWSMLESMASGVAMIASSTSPVLEVIEHGKNGLLVDFFSPQDLVEKICSVLDHPDGMQEMRNQARKTVQNRYDLQKLMPLHVALIGDLAEKRLPPPTNAKIEQLYL